MDRSIHLVVLQLKPRKGDYAVNLSRLSGIFSQLDSLEPRPHVAVFAETALTGYFVEGGIRDVAMTAGELARDLDATYRESVSGKPLDVCIGFYEVWNNAFYNSALYVTLGAGGGPEIRHVHRKLF